MINEKYSETPDWWESAQKEEVNLGENFVVISSPNDRIGIYKVTDNNILRLTNFILKIEKQVKDGSIYFDSQITTDSFSERLFFDPDELFSKIKLKRKLHRVLGLRLDYNNSIWNWLVDIIREYSSDQLEFFEIDSEPSAVSYEGIEVSETDFPSGNGYKALMNDETKNYLYIHEILGRIAPFIVLLSKQYQRNTDKGLKTYFVGEVMFSESEIFPFYDLPKDAFVDHNKLKKYLINKCELEVIKVATDVEWKELPACIVSCNNIPETIEVYDFGYDKKLSKYVTENIIVRKDCIDENNNNYMMSYDEYFGNNSLIFNTIKNDEFENFKRKFKDEFLEKWESAEVMVPTVAFTLLPLIYPWLKDVVPNKFYMMLKGSSGLGKSILADWMQQFYGNYNNLLSWTSTEAALNEIGHINKDALTVIDDFKAENFRSSSDIRWVMRFIQNYSDATGRQRAGGLKKIAESKFIRGFILISAEDLVVNQTSTLARGIVIDVKSKEPNTDLIDRINSLSKNFTAITIDYIQYILKNFDAATIQSYYKLNRSLLSTIVDQYDITIENRMRIIQNITAIMVSWQIFSTYLYGAELSEQKKKNLEIMKKLVELTFDTFRIVDAKKSYERFENALWDLAESKRIFTPIENYGKQSRSYNYVGYYEIIENNDSTRIKICLNLRSAYKIVNTYLSAEGGIGTSLETLQKQLLDNNLIRTTNSGIISFSDNKKVRGVEWIGEYSKLAFNL